MAETVHDLLHELDDADNEEMDFELRIETPTGSYVVNSFRWEYEAKHLVFEAGDIA